MSNIKWVQLSDIHFGSPDAFVIKTMREHFLERCHKLEGIDYLFITGDLRYGKDNPEAYPEETVQFLRNVQNTLGVSPCNTFMVPGNHDVFRGDGRKGTINAVMTTYTRGRTVSREHLKELEPGRQDYLKLYERICGIPENRYHFCFSKDGVNIIHINTAILCGRDNEDGSLVIDMLALSQALDSIDKDKPAIVLAHHPFNCLESHEQNQLEMLLKDHNAILYLCGHMHHMCCRNIKVIRPEIDLWEYVCGSNMDNLSNTEPAIIGFFVGELDTGTKSGYVEGVKWSKEVGAWLPNSEFSFPQDCAIDGKYFFPKRPTQGVNFIEVAHNKYKEYLKYECKIRLDGLPPVNNAIGSRAFELEKLFVPLRFAKPSSRYRNNSVSESQDMDKHKNPWWEDEDEAGFENLPWMWEESDENIIPAEGNIRLVVFSGPGGGKTTWMKRLALVYGIGNPENIEDNLPNRILFPIWIKCKQFREDVSLSVEKFISKIPERAGFATEPDIRDAFFRFVSEHIQNGTALLIIDGLDEIGNGQNRKIFIDNLNRFITMNKQVNIIITSRMVGYKLIAGSLSKDFYSYKIQPFNEYDIKRLCIDWYKVALEGNPNELDENAEKLVHTILDNEKILDLAQTPVLLMTLLLVHSWIGNLPTKRVELYKNAIDVLLRTWNVAGFPWVNTKEALPQLSYLAYNMMFIGKRRQAIGRSELEQILLQSRKDLPHFFSSSSETVKEFIDNVEVRSSILINRGTHKDENSDEPELEYEFSHFTFQEYLAAYAIVMQCYSNATRDTTIDTHFKDFFEEEGMKETILLTTVLTNRRWEAEDITNKLLEVLSNIRAQRHIDRQRRTSYIINLLMQIIADEAQLAPSMIETVYKTCFDKEFSTSSVNGIMAVYNSKYKEELQVSLQIIEKEWPLKYYSALFNLFELRNNKKFSAYTYFTEKINSENFLDVLQVFNMAVWLGNNWQETIPDTDNILKVKNILVDLCSNENDQLALSAYESLVSLCDYDDDIFSMKLLQVLYRLSDRWPTRMNQVLQFPIRQDTIPHLQGLIITSLQKEKLEKHILEENSIPRLLGYFWFGVIFGAWDVEYVVQKTKDFLESDYFDRIYKEMLRKKIKSYLLILQETNTVPAKSIDLVKSYLDELVQYEQMLEEQKKKNMFDW
ncbi:MAG: metallophosphoesterase [Bacteroidetes bacterium]|nr:metallophosphoesterase [Bacteroidota bacterium]